MEGVRKALDLCDRHAGPFAPGPAAKPPTARTEAPRATRKAAAPSSRRKVMTLDEIEAMKKS